MVIRWKAETTTVNQLATTMDDGQYETISIDKPVSCAPVSELDPPVHFV